MKGFHAMNTNKLGLLTGSIFITMLGLSQTSLAETSNNLDTLYQVQWNKSGSTPFQPIDLNQLPNNESNLIFIRPLDEDGLQTSANIAIDGRFQVSLQPGHFSQVRYCSGQHNISVAPTGMKVNDLNTPFSHQVEFDPQSNHYIFVEVDDATGQPRLSKLEEDYAMNLLNNQKEQTHQISRVVRNCAPAPVVEPEIKVEIDKPINLRVLFEFDKAVIQPAFNPRIEAVADFMKKHPDTTTVIEGHTDSMGSDRYNMDLSKRRAEAVKQELVNRYGISPNRLSTQGFGETRPVDTNATSQGRYNNRRVEATVSVNR